MVHLSALFAESAMCMRAQVALTVLMTQWLELATYCYIASAGDVLLLLCCCAALWLPFLDLQGDHQRLRMFCRYWMCEATEQ